MSTGRKVFVGFILAFNALMAVWLISALASHAAHCGTADYPNACQAGENIGKGIATVIILVIWALVDVILLVIFLVTRGTPKPEPTAWSSPRPPLRTCPHCAEQILYEAKVCKHCGRDVEPADRPEIPQWNCQTCGAPPAKPPTKNCLACGAVMPGWEHAK